MTNNITQYLKETDYGHHAGQVTTALRKYFKEVLKIKGIKVRKEAKGDIRYGGKVTGEHSKTIDLFIETKERFDIIRFIDDFMECEFKHLSQDRIFPMPYTINIKVNDAKLIDSYGSVGYLGTTIDAKFREKKVSEDMFWLKALENKGYEKTFIEFGND